MIKFSIIIFALSSNGTLENGESAEVYDGLIACTKGMSTTYDYSVEEIHEQGIIYMDCVPTIRTFNLYDLEE